MRNGMITLLLLFSTGISLHTQEIEAPRRMILFFEPVESPELTRTDLLLLYDSLLVKLYGADPDVLILETPDITRLHGEESEKRKLAEEMGADAWLHLTVEGSAEMLTFTARSFDMVVNSVVFDISFEQSGMKGLERLYWSEVTNAVSSSYDALPQRTLGEEKNRTELTLKGIPQTRIIGLTDDEIILGEDGSVSLNLYERVTYSFRAVRQGYYPQRSSVYITSPQSVYEIEQKRGSRFGAGIYMNNVIYPGIEGSVYIIPNLMFVRLGLTTFAFGLPRDEGEGIPNGFPLTNLIFSTGAYVSQADAFVRFYGGLGFFLRFNHIPQKYFGLDLVAPAGLSLIMGAEMSNWRQVRPYFEFSPLLYFITSPLLVEAAYSGSTGEPAPFSINEHTFIDARNSHVGVRFQL